MRAAWYERHGPAREVLQFGEMLTPQPGPGELRVKVAASVVHVSDLGKRCGRWPCYRAAAGHGIGWFARKRSCRS